MATDVKNDATLSTNLVSYWELEESSGTRVDSHGSNDLTDINTVGSGVGIQGTAASFVNANTESLIATGGTGFTMTNAGSFSIAGWVKVNTLITNGGIFCRWANTSKGFLVRTTAAGLVEAFVGDGSTTRSGITATTDISDGNWHHVAFTWNSSDDRHRLYINGSLEATAGSAQTISQSTAAIELGDNATALSASPWDGLIDEVGVWTKALSGSEITDLYNSGSAIPYEALTGNASRRLLFMGF